MKKRTFEVYNPEVDTEHLELWSGRLPGTRLEQIEWAQELADLSGKEVRINAWVAWPSRPAEPMPWYDKLWFAVTYGLAAITILILLMGFVVAIWAGMTGNIQP
jgi:hypothetical protein